MDSTFHTTARFYNFGPFCLDAARLLLHKNGEPVLLAPRFVRALLILVQNQGSDLDKTYLMDKLWPDTAVEENNLTVIISALRKVFGDDPGQHKYIVTIPGRGYRFVAEVSESGSEPGARPQEQASPAVGLSGRPDIFAARVPEKGVVITRKKVAWSVAVAALTTVALLASFAIRGWKTARASSVNTLAVLPFESVGFASEDDYLGLGMADGIVARLKNANRISVRPFGGVLAYQNGAYDPRATAQTLAADVLLTGAVQKTGTQIRVGVKLLRVKDGSILWSEELNGDLKQTLSFEDHIADHVADALTAKRDAREGPSAERRYTPNPEAYQFYLRGEYFLNHRSHSPADHDLKNAITNLQAAVDKDPQFALAYASLANAYNKVSWYLPAEQSYAKALDAAQRALSIDNQLAEAYRSLAVAKQAYAWDFPAAEAAFRRAIELDPRDPATHRWYADELLAEGRNQDAEREWGKAKELDPYSSMYDTLGRIYFYSRHYKEAFAELKDKEDLNPDVFWYVAWIHSFHRAELNVLNGPGISDPAITDRQPRACKLAFENAAARRRTAVEDCLKSVETAPNTPRISPYTAALLYAALGDNDKTFQWLDRARATHTWNFTYIKVDPRLDAVRNDARFDSLLASMGMQR